MKNRIKLWNLIFKLSKKFSGDVKVLFNGRSGLCDSSVYFAVKFSLVYFVLLTLQCQKRYQLHKQKKQSIVDVFCRDSNPGRQDGQLPTKSCWQWSSQFISLLNPPQVISLFHCLETSFYSKNFIKQKRSHFLSLLLWPFFHSDLQLRRPQRKRFVVVVVVVVVVNVAGFRRWMHEKQKDYDVFTETNAAPVNNPECNRGRCGSKY